MELNVLNEKLNVDVTRVHEVNEYTFWYIYTQLMNIRNPVLSDRDCSILAHILTLAPEGNILEKDSGKQLEELTRIKLSNLFGKCKELHEKGYLVKAEKGYTVHPSLLSFSKFVKQRSVDFRFTLPLRIV